MTLPFVLREGRLTDLPGGQLSDLPFAMDTWLTTNARTPSAREMLEAGIYWTEHKAAVRRLLTEKTFRVACVPEDENAILGWACTSAPPPDNPDPLVHYVYVRGKGHRSARRCGIATALLADFLPHACTYTHRPAYGRVKIPENWQFNPARIYR